MSRDDEDWTGEPPEGHIARDRARPGHAESQWQATVAKAVLGLVILAAVVVIVLAR